MRKSKFTEEQMAYALKQAELGIRVEEVCRKMGISSATFYKWRQKYAGVGPSELRRMRQLEEENRKLKQIVADLSLDKAMLQHIVAKMYGPPRDCKGQASGGISSHKCIRPLASGLLLQPGRDEIRTRRSQ